MLPLNHNSTGSLSNLLHRCFIISDTDFKLQFDSQGCRRTVKFLEPHFACDAAISGTVMPGASFEV